MVNWPITNKPTTLPATFQNPILCQILDPKESDPVKEFKGFASKFPNLHDVYTKKLQEEMEQWPSASNEFRYSYSITVLPDGTRITEENGRITKHKPEILGGLVPNNPYDAGWKGYNKGLRKLFSGLPGPQSAPEAMPGTKEWLNRPAHPDAKGAPRPEKMPQKATIKPRGIGFELQIPTSSPLDYFINRQQSRPPKKVDINKSR